MVAQKHFANAASYEFVLRPNRSMSWRANKWFFAITCILSLTVASGFSLMGAWMIFPFAGLEMLVLGIVLYVCACRAANCEVISIDNDRVTVCKGRYQPRESCEFQRIWARVWLRRSGIAWYPSQLLIRSHGREIEVGGFLEEDERQKLAEALAKVLHQQQHYHADIALAH